MNRFGKLGNRKTLNLCDADAWRLERQRVTQRPQPRPRALGQDLLEPSTLSPAERAYVQNLETWSFSEGAYVMIQGTKPQFLAYGFNDSPAGLAAWIVEQFRKFSDCGGEIESRFSKDELLTNIMIYWVTETINSSMRGYYERMHAGWDGAKGEASGKWSQPGDVAAGEVPVGSALFPKDAPPPRELAERFFNLQRFTEMPTGGHFAALEEPERLTADIRAFFRKLRTASDAQRRPPSAVLVSA